MVQNDLEISLKEKIYGLVEGDFWKPEHPEDLLEQKYSICLKTGISVVDLIG